MAPAQDPVLRGVKRTSPVHKILYACPAWWNGCNYQTKPLEKVQRRALRLICAAFKTTPTYALEIEASIPPIKHQANLITRRSAIRINKLPDSNPVLQRLPDTWRNNQQPKNPPPLPPSPKNQKRPNTVLQNLAKYTSPKHERINPFLAPPWKRTASAFPNRVTVNPCKQDLDSITTKNEHNKLIQSFKTKPDVLYIYTDGSKIQKPPFYRVGAAAVAFNENHETSKAQLGLGGHAEVYDAEMAALSLGASLAAEFINAHPNTSHIAFFTDNTAATLAISDPKPQAAQLFAAKFHNSITPLLETHPNLSISISWCPSHCGIIGNDRANQLAKEATQLERNTPYSVSRSNAVRRTKSTTLKLWKQEWEKQPLNGRYAIANRFPPSLRPTPHFQQLKDNRELFGRLTQCRTGHNYSGEFRESFLPHSQEPTSCPCNNVTRQTREHILRECTRYSQHRHILREASATVSLPTILGSKEGIQALTLFLKKSGAFTQSGNLKQPTQLPKFEDEPEEDTESIYSQPNDDNEPPNNPPDPT